MVARQALDQDRGLLDQSQIRLDQSQIRLVVSESGTGRGQCRIGKTDIRQFSYLLRLKTKNFCGMRQ
jgi:hypothetical protein